MIRHIRICRRHVFKGFVLFVFFRRQFVVIIQQVRIQVFCYFNVFICLLFSLVCTTHQLDGVGYCLCKVEADNSHNPDKASRCPLLSVGSLSSVPR